MDEKELKEAELMLTQAHVDDWCLFASDVLGANLDPEQQEILRSCQFNKKTSVRSGTARGKDYISAVAGLCFFYLTPGWDDEGILIENTKVAMTAPTDRQVGNIMFPEVTRLFNTALRRGYNLPGRLTGHDIRTAWDEWFLTGFKADDKNTEAWTGFHAPNVMFIVTEASGIPETIWNAIEGNLQGNSRLLIVFNDNTGTGYAAESQKSSDWKSFRLDSLTAPNVIQKKVVIPGQVDWEWVDGRVQAWCEKIDPKDFQETEGDFWWEGIAYRPNDLFRVKVRGMAPKAPTDVLVPVEWIEAANRRWAFHNQNKFPIKSPLRLGVDVAGMGRDSSVFCPRHGDYVKPFEQIQSAGAADHMKVAGTVLNMLKKETDIFLGKYPQTFIDTIGEGAGVYSRLIELKDGADAVKDHSEKEFLKSLKVHSAKFSEAAKDEAGNHRTDMTEQYKFLNMRAYCYWSVRDWLDPSKGSKAMLPPDKELEQELSQTKWFFRSDGTIQIEEKKEIRERINRSPDKADGLAETFWPVPDHDPVVKPKRNIAGFFH